jgi:hypothetical protein
MVARAIGLTPRTGSLMRMVCRSACDPQTRDVYGRGVMWLQTDMSTSAEGPSAPRAGTGGGRRPLPTHGLGQAVAAYFARLSPF